MGESWGEAVDEWLAMYARQPWWVRLLLAGDKAAILAARERVARDAYAFAMRILERTP